MEHIRYPINLLYLSPNVITLINTHGVVAGGPLIRAALTKYKTNVKQEIIIWLYAQIDFKTFGFLKLTNHKDRYTTELDNIKIVIFKKIYKNWQDVLTSQTDWHNQIGYNKGDIVMTNNLKKITDYIDVLDPNNNKISDILNIYEETYIIFDLIDRLDIDKLKNISKIHYDDIHDITGLNSIEYAIMLYKDCHESLKYNYKQIITLLSDHYYTRSSKVYYKLSNIQDKYLDNLISNVKNKYECEIDDIITDTNPNRHFIRHFIKLDKHLQLIDYITFYNISFNTPKDPDLELIIKHNSRNVLRELIVNNKIESTDILRYIYLTEALNLIKHMTLSETDIITVGTSFLMELIQNNKILSIYYLLTKTKTENLFMETLVNCDENNENIVKLLFKLKPQLINDLFDNKPYIFTIPNMSINYMNFILSHNNIDFNMMDNNNNNILHMLSKNGRLDIITNIGFDKLNGLINKQNKDGYTPLILAALNKHEDLVYFLLKQNVDTDMFDKYGNSCYHYICLNKICFGIKIKNITNKFGFTPLKYANMAITMWQLS